ncbi:hypothetical protein KIL84_002846 [Mauremys mutica]|uniref:Uncharacterized protein n=1 Tax=Mauremys mutica TaxID=74926 RepID=A0A9D3WU27_9SAUR|nr:hypothetical protein KIL84_002846 [Mauremys mutica]
MQAGFGLPSTRSLGRLRASPAPRLDQAASSRRENMKSFVRSQRIAARPKTGMQVNCTSGLVNVGLLLFRAPDEKQINKNHATCLATDRQAVCLPKINKP